ncbi:MAG: hypothetical protein ACQESD_00890 [Thermoplasmatota archaeon]
MSEKVLSTKVSEEDVETIKSIAEEKGSTVSSLLRELLHREIKTKKVDWDSTCFGTSPREDKPNKEGAEVDNIFYGDQ